MAREKRFVAIPNPDLGRSFYANRVEWTTTANSENHRVYELEVNTGYFSLGNVENEVARFMQAVPVLEEGRKLVVRIPDSAEWFYSIDLSDYIPEGWTATVRRLTSGKPYSLGLIAYHPDYKHEIADVHTLTNADLRDPDAEQCTEIRAQSQIMPKNIRCEREEGHFGYHQAFAEGSGYQWDDAFATATPFGTLGFKVACPRCGFVDRGNSSGVKKCQNCSFWETQKTTGGVKFIIDGKHYRPGRGGFGGNIFNIRRLTDGTLWSGELFHQGDIPSWFIEEFPDNAVFVKK